MAEEKVEPPNEKIGWKEIIENRDQHYYKNFIFYEIRAYQNVLFPTSLGTFAFFGGEVILKALFTLTGPDKDIDRTYFLKLDNGTWVRGVLNGSCNMRLETKEERDSIILEVVITVQMANELKTRILIKKI